MTSDDNFSLWAGSWDFLQTELGLSPSEQIKQKVKNYHALLKIANHEINLTKLSELPDFLEGHLKDTAFLIKFLPSHPISGTLKYLDLGSGCGSPGIIFHLLAKGFSRLHTYLCENRPLRANFLKEAITQLELEKEIVVFPHKSQYLTEKFDLITARAVAKPIDLLKLISPHLLKGGRFLAQTNEELIDSKPYIKACHQEGLKIIDHYDYRLYDFQQRFVTVLERI
ncbi:MAG: RsmG family class I SAM-dependent methyltransferase [Candidatus Caenarcaniphilales bacterium]|nr:RsmG family class I SAM-dependent methyltransferase [Candidatus Caenarcaniphilales bacterium]